VLRSALTDLSYDLPLTLKTYVPEEWKTVEVRQGERTQAMDAIEAAGSRYVLYQAEVNSQVVTLSRATHAK